MSTRGHRTRQLMMRRPAPPPASWRVARWAAPQVWPRASWVIAIPGIGAILAAGPIAAALVGAGAGAVAGGLIGGLVDLGVPETHAEYYAEAVRRGGALVTVRTDASRTDEAEKIMRENGAIDIDDRVARWRSAGWKGYNPNDAPFSHDEIERDRSTYRPASHRTRAASVRFPSLMGTARVRDSRASPDRTKRTRGARGLAARSSATLASRWRLLRSAFAPKQSSCAAILS